MSGGHFDYQQYRIEDIADDIRSFLDQKSWEKEDEYGHKPYQDITPEVIQAMEDGYQILLKAAVYAQRIDWYLSGDDGANTFLKRLKDGLTKLEETKRMPTNY